MNNATPLKLGSGGYTLVPNWLFDSLLREGSDALALGLLLLRITPGQSASFALTGETSRQALCRALGWGESNWRRFKAAMTSVETAGGVRYEVVQGNTPIVSVTGELAGKGRAEVAGEGDAETAGPPRDKSAGQAADHTRAVSSSEKENNNKKTPPHVPAREAALPSTGAGNAKPREEEAGSKSVLAAFETKLGSRVAPAVRRSFASEFAASGLTIDEALAGTELLAAHPYLAASTLSPKRLFYLADARLAAARVDAEVGRAMAWLDDEYVRRGREVPEAAVVGALRLVARKYAPASGMDEERFVLLARGYYGALIDALSPREARTRAA